MRKTIMSIVAVLALAAVIAFRGFDTLGYFLLAGAVPGTHIILPWQVMISGSIIITSILVGIGVYRSLGKRETPAMPARHANRRRYSNI